MTLPRRISCPGHLVPVTDPLVYFHSRRDDTKFINLVLEHDGESDIIAALKTLVDIKNVPGW